MGNTCKTHGRGRRRTVMTSCVKRRGHAYTPAEKRRRLGADYAPMYFLLSLTNGKRGFPGLESTNRVAVSGMWVAEPGAPRPRTSLLLIIRIITYFLITHHWIFDFFLRSSRSRFFELDSAVNQAFHSRDIRPRGRQKCGGKAGEGKQGSKEPISQNVRHK